MLQAYCATRRWCDNAVRIRMCTHNIHAGKLGSRRATYSHCCMRPIGWGTICQTHTNYQANKKISKLGLNRPLISGSFREQRIYRSGEEQPAIRGRHQGAEHKPYIQWDTDVLCGTMSVGRGLEFVVGCVKILNGGRTRSWVKIKAIIMTFFHCRAQMEHRNAKTCKVCVSITSYWL